MNTYSSLSTNCSISSKLLNTVNISSLPMRATTKVICSTSQSGFREPTVLVMEDGATATLYSALDGTTVLEGPDGATTVLPSSPQSEVASAGEVLLSDSSKTSLVVRRGHAITAATSQGTSSKGAAVSSESASTTSSATLHVLPKNVEAILVANNGVNLCGGTYVTKSQSVSCNSSNSVSVISSVYKKAEASPSATRFYSNKNYLKRPQVFKHLSNGDSSQSLLVNTAISRNVIEASKQASPISYVTIKPASDLYTEETYRNPTEPNVTVVKKSSVDYNIVPRIAVAVMPSKESPQNHNTTNLVLASGEEVARNPTPITTLGTRQIVSAGSFNTPTILASIPPGSFIETSSLNQFASTDNNSLILENGRIIRGSLVPKYTPPESQIFSNGSMEGEAMEVVESGTVVPSSGSPDNATVTTAVYESGGVTAIVDSHGGMATVIKGAEVVRSSAVSYATPIMHQVYFQPNTESIVDSIEEGFEEVNVSVTTDITSSPTVSSTSSSDDESSSSRHRSSLLQLRRVGNQPVVHDEDIPMNLCVNQSAESGGTGTRDDELTPLNWLQDTNLLKSTALSPVKHKQQIATTSTAPHLMGEQIPKVSTKHFQPMTPPGRHPAYGVEPMREVKAESPTSDYGGEESNERTSETPPGVERTGGTVRAQTVSTYGPKMQVSSKPPYSFSCLIFMAIEDSEEKALPVKSIYAWVLHHFPHYRTANAGWKNSVRHNLSLNKCFKKVDKSPVSNMGKGSLWMVDPEHRATLLQSLSKVPFHPYSSLERVHSLSLRHGGVHNSRNGDPHISLHQDPSLLGTSPASIFGKEVQYRPNPSRYNNHHQSTTGDNHRHNETTNKYTRNVTTYSNKVASKSEGGNTGGQFDNLDPSLFPYLSRTFSSGSIGILDGVGVEDVHAAAAMLTLKHGHDPLTSIQQNLSRLTADEQGRYKTTSQNQKAEPVVMVISSSAGQDHSYTNQPSTLYSSSHSARRGKIRGEKLSTSPTSSVDEAFSEESFESDIGDTQNSPSDIQQMVDGADALLNFAARATTMLPRLNYYDNPQPASSSTVSKNNQQQRVIYITQYTDGSTSEPPHDNNNKRPLVSKNEIPKRLKTDPDEEEAESAKKIRRVRKVVDTKHIVTQGVTDNLQTPSKIRTLNLSSRPAFIDSNKAGSSVRKYKTLDEGTNRKGRRIGASIQSKSSRVYLHSRR